MYIHEINLNKLKNGGSVLAHKMKLNNIHSYVFIEREKLIIKDIGFNVSKVALI